MNENKLNWKVIAVAGGILFVALVVIIIVVLKAVGGDNNTLDNAGSGSDNGHSYWEESIKVGDIVEFGTYEQDGNTANGAEPIEWQVVNQDGDYYLLVSHYILDCQNYDDGSGQNSDASGLEHKGLVYYENSHLRKWLNESFAQEAFGSGEEEFLQLVSVKEDDVTRGEGNAYATDSVFVLSFDELRDYLGAPQSYGTDDNGYPYLKTAAWMCPATDYALNRGCQYKTNQEILAEYNATAHESVKFTDDAYTDPEIMKYATGGVRDEDYLVKGNYGVYWMRERFTDEDSAAGCSYLVNSFGLARYADMQNMYGVRPAIYVKIQNPAEEESATLGTQPASEHLAKFKGLRYKCQDSPHGLTMDGAFIEILCGEHLITDNIQEMSIHGALLCFDGTMDVRNFVYYEANGKECYESETDYFKMEYDPANKMFTTYSNTDKLTGDEGLPQGEWVKLFDYYLFEE